MIVDVDVEIIEDALWCEFHNAHHRTVYTSQPTTHQGIPLGPARVYDECVDEQEGTP